jgi:hypothetical protein
MELLTGSKLNNQPALVATSEWCLGCLPINLAKQI